ncbi:NAD(P)H-dependent oxidoreductase [Mycolicibacterium sp. 050232]|uniref:NAD(P)H-dependent oxidoreductase n=1 Tax=Mycolicibacterium sp. 050232 TaxID=3113982 RepID=UPI002E2B35B1|nr:NAD(P)H-dependent oxidoreductase [Mycolicibacterium sp. 050232]MED5813640.1 NAD(P)H-dependent oxidoreductase [Mycolicibacterium sp. 050232]
MTAKSCPTTILVLVGSLRAASTNQRLAEAMTANAPPGVTMKPFEHIAELPLYNEDLDHAEVASAVVQLRSLATHADALLVVTPEYNGTIPGGLKNVIDWLSRPYGRSPLKGKPAAVVGTSLGQYGGVWAHDDTRKALSIAGPRIIDTVHVSIPAKALEDKPFEVPPVLLADLIQVLGDLSAAAHPS